MAINSGRSLSFFCSSLPYARYLYSKNKVKLYHTHIFAKDFSFYLTRVVWPVSSKAIQASGNFGQTGYVCLFFLCNWPEIASTSTWTMAFRDCRPEESLGTKLVVSVCRMCFRIIPLIRLSTIAQQQQKNKLNC